MSIGFANNYTHLHLIKDDKGQWLYLGQGISTVEWENEDTTDDTAYYNSGGAQPEDVTGVKVGATVSGHRYYGDPAQDYVASLVTKIGDARVTDLRRIAPDGSMLEGPITVKDIVDGGGEANEKGTFEFGFTYREMPKYVGPQSTDMPETISFEEPLTVKAGETLDLATKVKVTPEGATPNCVFAVDDDSLEEAKAIVDAAGILTAKTEGTIKVTAKCVSKPAVTATAEVTISGEG